MKLSDTFIRTLKEFPGETANPGHQFLVKGGFIRKIAPGLYGYLPSGYRVIRKIEDIIRQEMEPINCQEIYLPMLHPVTDINETGFIIRDMYNRKYTLGLNYKDIIAGLGGKEIRSYRELPVFFYHIYNGFTEKFRPRDGLLKPAEGILLNIYSFHKSDKELEEGYCKIMDAFRKIFARCGLNVKLFEKGYDFHKFIVINENGEEDLFSCQCGYNALEPEISYGEMSSVRNIPEMERVFTPGVTTIEEVTAFMNERASSFVKTLIYKINNEPLAVLVRGDRELCESKLRKYLKVKNFEMADTGMVEMVTGASVGFAGPSGLNIRILADYEVKNMTSCITGANITDYHMKNVCPGRDFAVSEYGDFRNAFEGDICPLCRNPLSLKKGFPCGFSDKSGEIDNSFVNEKGEEEKILMSWHSIGISQIMGAIAEESHDVEGIIWPDSVSPYRILILLLNPSDEKQKEVAFNLYEKLQKEGIDVLIDDRDIRVGVKFKDADLLGIPLRIAIGNRTLKENSVEITKRGKNEKTSLPLTNISEIINLL
jgi:prolyl-tRNA synthetase